MPKVVWLKGDYIGQHERQKQAAKRKCDFVISFHFNSFSSPNAAGAEVYYNNKPGSDQVAKDLLRAIVSVLNVPNRGCKNAAGTRAAFIDSYHCKAVLIEPCFVSNPNEAKLLHDIHIVKALAHALAKVVASFGFQRIGIDIGHRFKTSNPNDKGAQCVFSAGCSEALHAEHLAKAFAAELEALESEARS